MYALALALLPLAMAGATYQQPMMMYPQQKNWGSNQMGFQLTGMIQPQMQQMPQMQQQMPQMPSQSPTQQGNTQWWNMANEEEYEAYLKWCEERQMAIQQQEEQQALLKEMEMRAEQVNREKQREKAAKEMQMKRESMVAQWNMWKSQLEEADAFDGRLDGFTEMKNIYVFKLTTEFLDFCRCADYASHLQKYLIYGKESYTPSTREVFSGEGWENLDTTSVDAVAQRAATLSGAQQVNLLFSGAIGYMCEGVETYIKQVMAWEQQYNFMA